MEKYLEIVRSVLPHFKENNIEKSFKDNGLDSIDLVTIRVGFERLIGKTISDKDWIKFNSFYEIVQYCKVFEKTLNVLEETSQNIFKISRFFYTFEDF